MIEEQQKTTPLLMHDAVDRKTYILNIKNEIGDQEINGEESSTEEEVNIEDIEIEYQILFLIFTVSIIKKNRKVKYLLL